jgi:hypothetical protein
VKETMMEEHGGCVHWVARARGRREGSSRGKTMEKRGRGGVKAIEI